MLTMYLKDNKTTHWAAALPVIQAAKNRRFHRGINMSPFEAMFGKRMTLGSEDMEIPSNEMRGLPSNEEDLEPEPLVELNGEDWVTDVEDRYIPGEDKENSSEDRSAWESDDEADLSVAAQLHHRAMRIVQQREGARVGQKRQAESMLQSSAKRYAPVDVGTSVRVPVPARLILASTSLGMFHCMCTADCRTARCTCVRAGRACGSRCHKSNTCANKAQDTNYSATEAADENMQPETSASS